jgi:ABC-2 type transport system permease protein
MNLYLRLMGRSIRNSFSAAAGFRANFIISFLTSIGWISVSFFMIGIVFSNTNTLLHWSRAEAFAVFGLYELLDGLVSMFFWDGIALAPQLIRDGSMDYIVTKPVDSQFQVSVKQFRLASISEIGTGVIVLIYAFSIGDFYIQAPNVFYAVLMVLAAVVLYYSIAIMAVTLNFWFIRLENMSMLLMMSVIMARYPLDVFTGVMQKFVFYVLPLAFLATVPAIVLFNKGNPIPWLLGAVVLATIFFCLSRILWLAGVKSYSSASS